MLYRVLFDPWRVFEAVHIDHVHDVALAIRTARKAFDSAGLAEKMVDHFGVEPIGRQIIRPRNQGEIGLGNGLHHPAQSPAARTVAVTEARKVGSGRKAHGAAMALTLIFLFFGHGILLAGTKEEHILLRVNQADITISSTLAALLG